MNEKLWCLFGECLGEVGVGEWEWGGEVFEFVVVGGGEKGVEG